MKKNNNTNTQTDQLQKAREELQKNRKNKKKGLLKRIVIGASALAAAFLTIFGIKAAAKRNNKVYTNTTSQTSNSMSDSNSYDETSNDNQEVFDLETKTISSIGIEMEISKTDKTKNEYSSDEIDTTEIVEDKDGNLWINDDAASKKDDIDKTIIDTNDGEYIETEDGKVVEKDPSYEIIDENGDIIDEGDKNPIDEYEWDEEVGKYLPKDQVGKYILDSEGNLWLKEDYERYQEELKNSQTVTNSEFIPVESETSNTSKNEIEDGTMYTDSITGLIFESKADYEQWVLQDFEGYGILNGVMVAKTDEMIAADKKVLTR